MRKLFTTLALIAISTTLFAGNSGNKSLFPDGKLSFKPIVTIFADYRIGVNNVIDKSKLSIKRSYIGFKLDNGGEWSGRVIFDIFDVSDYSKLEFTSYLKNASVTWRRSDLEINIGVIKTNNFGVQEKFWGHRYVMKSFTDEYGIAPSADLGISASYKFYDWMKADVSITNGKGYKDLEVNKNFRYGAGLTFNPIEGLTLRAYYDIYIKDNRLPMPGSVVAPSPGNQHIISAFAGYKHDKFSVGGEANYVINSGFIYGRKVAGISLYSTAKIIDKLNGFARYDNFFANNDAVKKRGNGVRAGVDYKPFKFLRVSPNVYNWKPKNMPSQTYIFLNLLLDF